MPALRVALGQMDVRVGSPAHNLECATVFAAEAARGGATLLVLPELWATGYDLANNEHHVPTDGCPHLETVVDLARRYELMITGSLVTRRQNRFYNTATLVGPDGAVLLSYDKLHLFRLMDEHLFLQPGCLGEQLACALPGGAAMLGNVALAVCYDLRFPELFRRYAALQTGLVLVPAEWPQPRIEHWRLLLRARAIENQCFVVGVNRVGRSGDTVFGGHSLVCDPWGDVLVEGGGDEGVLFADLAYEAVLAAHERLPVLSDRRPDLWPLVESVHG